MSSAGAASRAAVPAPTARTRAVAPKSNARAEASRKNGAKSRGPKTPEGKARSSQNALKHGMRAEKYVVLPQEDAGEFAALEAALVAELAPVGALQTVLARRVAVAAWRLARADRLEAEVLEFRSYEGANAGMALIRDGNGTRAVETLLRYRGAAMAEFWRALKTLKALRAEQAVEVGPALEAHPRRPAAPPPLAHGRQPSDPEHRAGSRLAYVPTQPGAPGGTLHEAAAFWLPKEPETGRAPHAPAPLSRTNPKPPSNSSRPEEGESCPGPRPGGDRANPKPTGIAAR